VDCNAASTPVKRPDEADKKNSLRGLHGLFEKAAFRQSLLLQEPPEDFFYRRLKRVEKMSRFALAAIRIKKQHGAILDL
jgi:hypothetical protein